MTWDVCDRIRKPCAQSKPPARALGSDLGAMIALTQHALVKEVPKLLVQVVEKATDWMSDPWDSHEMKRTLCHNKISHSVSSSVLDN